MQGLLEELVINLAAKTSAAFTKRDYSSHCCIRDPNYNIINVVTQPSRSTFLNYLFLNLFTVKFNMFLFAGTFDILIRESEFTKAGSSRPDEHC
jgi:hypothetical protein